MNFEGFATMVDAMDGLPVCLPEAMKDRKAQLDLPAGEQTVDGEDALSLARTRYAVGDGSDIARMGHQQRVMSAIIQRAKSTEVLARPDRLYGFLDAVTSSLTVDPDLDSIPALASLAQTAVGVDDDQITFMVMPWQAAPEDPNRVVPADEAAEVFSRIRIDAPMDGSDPTRSADEDAAEESTEDTAAEAAETDADEAPGDSPVTVINGSTIDGKAAQVQQRAEDWGFTVADTSTAASARQTTEIGHDGSARAEATAQQLADRLDADAVVHEDVRSGVTLMLGLDIEDVLPAEDTAAEVPGTDAGEADDPAHDSGSTSGATVGTAGTTVDSVDLCA
ncbi:transcriptional attenuator, LytR family [Brevibacterium sp. Mu109]|nr:transcriptional attenuator, LytR family [Brevibacterium sp. Mu109]